jgi:single-stranded DNA-binding protein
VARRRHLVLKVNVWRGQAEHLADSLTKGDRVMVTGRLRQRSWETPEGDKRSVTELEADEVGASLKWATAKVERVSQRGNGDAPRPESEPPSAGATSTKLHPYDHPRQAVVPPASAGGAAVTHQPAAPFPSTSNWRLRPGYGEARVVHAHLRRRRRPRHHPITPWETTLDEEGAAGTWPAHPSQPMPAPAAGSTVSRRPDPYGGVDSSPLMWVCSALVKPQVQPRSST